MEGISWIIEVMIFGGIIWLLTRLSVKPTSRDWAGLVRKPDDAIDTKEHIIRRAHAVYNAEVKKRYNERLLKQDYLESDQNKIDQANNFVTSCRLDTALLFVWERTHYWVDSSRYQTKWKTPIDVTDLDGSSKGTSKIGSWIEFRPDGERLYSIRLDDPRPHGIDLGYFDSSITLSVDGEIVLCISVTTDSLSEWSSWGFTGVKSLKVGPWVEGFVALYAQLLSIGESEVDDRNAAQLRDQAARIDLGNLDGRR